jgi:hypothetical protein
MIDLQRPSITPVAAIFRKFFPGHVSKRGPNCILPIEGHKLSAVYPVEGTTMSAASPNFALVTLVAEVETWQPGLLLLLQERAYACAAGKGIAGYTVSAERLRQAGLSDEQLRVLLDSRCIKNVANGAMARSNGRQRTFGPEQVAEQSHFVLTDAGVAPAREVYLRLVEFRDVPAIAKEMYTHLTALGALPWWDIEGRELRFGSRVEKKFGVLAKCQELILTGYQEIDWKRHLDNSLPPGEGITSSQRLRDALHALNDTLRQSPIHFCSDGYAHGSCWAFK